MIQAEPDTRRRRRAADGLARGGGEKRQRPLFLDVQSLAEELRSVEPALRELIRRAWAEARWKSGSRSLRDAAGRRQP